MAHLCKRSIYEPYLKWVAKSGLKKELDINPDLMVQRDDGFFDIYDLKTAAPNRKSITKGKRNRRRFIDYVEEGIAQLAHYEEYFRYDENCKFAFENYGIKVSNPNLYLVAGNLENANEQQLDEACRKLKNIKVIDYDTLSGMFYKSVFRS